MAIKRVKIENYRTLRSVDIVLGSAMNIIVGDNETGKSTLLEAINLALTCQLNRRPAQYELHPFLINLDAVDEFIESHQNKTPIAPPSITIELFFEDEAALADLKGMNNSEGEDTPGIKLKVSLSDSRHDEFAAYVSDPEKLNSVPIEYYDIDWTNFADNEMRPYMKLVKAAMIDPSSISNSYGANKYMLELARDVLSPKQQGDLALSYRTMRDVFRDDPNVTAINAELATKTGSISQKTLTMEMDTTTRASWDTGVMPHLDHVPLTLVGKGEQNTVKIKLALENNTACHILLMEEPENHLSHTNLNKLISHVSTQADNKQLIVTTHSSFVLNKLGVDNVLMFDGTNGVFLDDLPDPTKKYFQKLPGYDTLRMILSRRTILVEGPSDELFVQKAYQMTYGVLPMENGVEVISVRALAFKRFLDIAERMSFDVRVLTDNDGNYAAVESKYADHLKTENITLCCDDDPEYPTLEPQLLKANNLDIINNILDKTFETESALLTYMNNNKTDVALKFLETDINFNIPEYIVNAITE